MNRLKQLIVEIHRRSMWQVTLVYVGGSWAMLGHVDLLIELGLPEWLFRATAIVLAVGLLAVLAVAAWPRVTPKIKRRVERARPTIEAPLRYRRVPSLRTVLISVVFVAVVFLLLLEMPVPARTPETGAIGLLFLGALWPIVTILGYILIRRTMDG